MEIKSTLLVINASCRVARSLTRLLSTEFVKEWEKNFADAKIIERDVGVNPPPFISEDWLEAAYRFHSRTNAMKDLLAYSDACIKELREASVLVLALPMYNYGMPAISKLGLIRSSV